MIGAGAAGARRRSTGVAHRRHRSTAGVSGRLVVCPTPIGNLEDVTLRVLAALREADVVACEDTRHTRVLLERYGVSRDARQLPRAQRARAGGRAGRADARRRGRRAGERRGDAAGQRSRLRAACRAASPPGWRSRCCRGRRARSTALVASALPSRRLALRRLPPAQARRRWRRCFAAPETARRVRVPAPRRRVAGGARRARPRAPRRGLPRADQAARGDRARHARRSWRRATRTRTRAARSSLVIGGAPAPRRRRSRRRSTRSAGWSSPAPAREDRGEGRRRAHRRPRTRSTARSPLTHLRAALVAT